MESLKIIPLFEVGTEVIDFATKRVGKVSKIWTRVNKISLTEYKIEVSYSVFRDRGYNAFRATQENLREIVYDEYGNTNIMPEGLSSKN